MKILRNSTRALTSQSGSVIIQVLIVGVILTIVGGTALSYFGRQNALHASKRVLEEVDALQALMIMTLSNEAACNINLTGPRFGNTPGALNGREVEVAFPAPSNTILRANNTYNNLNIRSITFANPVQINPPDPTYLADLTFEVRDAVIPVASRKFVIPFYFIQTGGTFSSCFATTYPNPQPPPPDKITMEDAICRNWQLREGIAGNDFMYAPFYKTCVREP